MTQQHFHARFLKYTVDSDALTSKALLAKANEMLFRGDEAQRFWNHVDRDRQGAGLFTVHV